MGGVPVDSDNPGLDAPVGRINTSTGSCSVAARGFMSFLGKELWKRRCGGASAVGPTGHGDLGRLAIEKRSSEAEGRPQLRQNVLNVAVGGPEADATSIPPGLGTLPFRHAGSAGRLAENHARKSRNVHATLTAVDIEWRSSVTGRAGGRMKRVLGRIQESHANHRERRRKSGFEFALADRVRLLSPDGWDAVIAGSSVFLRREVLEAIESSGPRAISPRYALIAEQGRPVAAVAAQMISLGGDRLVGERARAASSDGKKSLKAKAQEALKGLGRKGATSLKARVLVGGNLLAWGNHGIAIAPGEDPARLWPAIAEAMYRIRAAEGLFEQTDYVLIKDVPAPQRAASESLRRYGYRPVETDPDMLLEIPAGWRGYDDYLASLNSKYRKSARGILSDAESAGYVVESLTSCAGHEPRLHELYMNVHNRASVRPVTAPETYLPALGSALGSDRFRCSVLRRGNEVAGFVTTIKDGETAIGYYIGIDYAANEQAPVYLRLLHATVADAIALDCRRLSLGRTALEPKARLGARPLPLSVWVRHRVSLMNYLIRPLLGAIPHDEPPERSVQK